MVDATCLNEDCEKDTWTLTKHPDDYSRGVSCPGCGTTRVEHDAEERHEDQPGGARKPQGRSKRQQPHDSSQPARERRDPQQEERAPARRETRQREAVQTRREGPELSAAEGLIATLDDDAPASVKKKGIETIGGGVIRLFQSAIDYNSKKKEMAEERATQANIQKAEDKPACECGYTFAEIGTNDERIQCPECGTEYEVYVD